MNSASRPLLRAVLFLLELACYAAVPLVVLLVTWKTSSALIGS